MAYSPLGSTGGPLFTAEPVVKIAEKHGVKPSAVLLSYHSMLSLCPSICSCHKGGCDAENVALEQSPAAPPSWPSRSRRSASPRT
jgi:diketogulonate reductase-like aldo/keto reductase